ncbi:MAG: SDR family NAD(P)-dependent oxidoreductase [Gammaproteobacteria bacterium]|nr:SDR family NAD(P)-dependent oxidoreductase [Gammaproteobacteria bacterium]
MKLRSRKILITGASSGIGRETCKRLLNDGHQVIGIARDFSKFPCDDDAFTPITIDLEVVETLPEQLQALAKAQSDTDAIICCAGRGQFGSLEEFSYEQIRSLINLNFISQAFIARAFLPVLKRQQSSTLIFIGSEAALRGSRKGSIYCASKFALRGLAQALRDECSKSGVSVSIINPGMVKTKFFDELSFSHGDEEDNYLLPEDVVDAIALIINARGSTVIDEINLSPLKHVVQSKPAN